MSLLVAQIFVISLFIYFFFSCHFICVLLLNHQQMSTLGGSYT